MEKVVQGWRRVRPYLLGFLVVLVVAGAIWVLIYVPKMQVPVSPPGQEGLPPKICFDIENEGRKTLAYIMGGILAIIGIYMAHRRIRALERQVQIGQEQLQVAQEGQITERFTRAIEQLGSQEMAIRLGGIYALERIANDSDKDYWPIMETLSAYVRERAPWRESDQDLTTPPPKNFFLWNELGESPPTTSAPVPKPGTDIQAVLTVLGRRKYRYRQGEAMPLDLSGTDLRGADFGRLHLEGAFFIGTNLERAFLWGAHLQRTKLRFARLEGSILEKAHLEGADLKDVIGLTRDQLAVAILDEKTRLPDYLHEETQEGKGPEGDKQE